jgi:hypothetical protein
MENHMTSTTRKSEQRKKLAVSVAYLRNFIEGSNLPRNPIDGRIFDASKALFEKVIEYDKTLDEDSQDKFRDLFHGMDLKPSSDDGMCSFCGLGEEHHIGESDCGYHNAALVMARIVDTLENLGKNPQA